MLTPTLARSRRGFVGVLLVFVAIVILAVVVLVSVSSPNHSVTKDAATTALTAATMLEQQAPYGQLSNQTVNQISSGQIPFTWPKGVTPYLFESTDTAPTGTVTALQFLVQDGMSPAQLVCTTFPVSGFPHLEACPSPSAINRSNQWSFW